ncbi:NBAS subunit of NRZ tethering complex-like [Oratosquilla oratoria]|uniref:NBAS subunit of NRZ tethering complex-like n=1 Tax=Oratosquilla oratoria TaxID=337810 RepID=UPI003F76C650
MSRSDRENNILYELLVHAEWPLEPEIIGDGLMKRGGSIFWRTLTQTPGNIWALASSIIGLLTRRSSFSPELFKILGSSSDWQLSVGAQGAVIALVQGSVLEIRAKKDDFATVVGKNVNLVADPFPAWRRVAWSSDCSMVGVAYSSGTVEIFNTVGNSLFTIYPPKYREGVNQVDASNALAALIFSDVRTHKNKWGAELILVDYVGRVRSYWVSPPEGYQESHTFSFYKLYPFGITAATLTGTYLLVSGWCSYLEDPNLRNNGLGHGMTLWRMVDDFPYYKQVATVDEEEYVGPSHSILYHLSNFKSSPRHDAIFCLCVSPSGRQVAALHISGSLSIWELPSLRKKKFWKLQDQPDFDSDPIQEYVPGQHHKLMHYTGPYRNHLIDVSWWSEGAVILARFSGAVTVSSINSLSNLLGESPEFLEGTPQVSEAYDRGFLALEVESRINSKRLLDDSAEEEDYLDSDDEEDMSFVRRTGRLAKSILFWVTDAERFRPPSKKPKIVSKTYRLLCLKSTTPEELFSRKIDNEEYGEALALARSYNLDCDRVYQQQWRRSPVTVASIQDFLSKIKKRSWVLAECLNRVPENIDAAKELLVYGLQGTDLEAIIAMGKEDKGEFLVCGSSGEWDEGYDADPCQSQAKAQEIQAMQLKRKRELLAQIDFTSLTAEQKSTIKARQKLLTYLDRLSTYEVILGGPHVAAEHYLASFFEKFRSQSAVAAAVEFAQNYNWHGVEAMLLYHGQETLPHRLAIISHFPPTMGPFEYRSLLPECDVEGEVFAWEQEELRDQDWCEEPMVREAVEGQSADPSAFLYNAQPDLRAFHGLHLDGDVVSKWYQYRAKQIEQCSHFVDASLDLLKLGRERNVKGLEELHDILDSLEVMVYEAGLHTMTLSKFIMLSRMETIQLLMSTSTAETYVQNIRRWLLPFLARCEKWEPGSSQVLLREYVVSTAQNNLTLPLKVLLHSRIDQHAPILSSAEEVMNTALQCVYACDNPVQLPRAFKILECLPERNPSTDTLALAKLHDAVDSLEGHLNAAELLSNNGVSLMPNQIRTVQDSEENIIEILTKLTRAAARREPSLKAGDWKQLLYDTLELQQKVFTCIRPQLCFEILTETLLCSGVEENIALAGEFLEVRLDRSPVHNPYLQKVPYDQSVSLVIKAATQYFNSSDSHMDEAINLALQCLRLIEGESSEIQEELDLITALHLLPDFGINRLPLQVRLCEDRLVLIEEALKSKKGSYRHGTQLLRLANLLRVCRDDMNARRAKVLTLVAQAAFKAGDYSVASSWCEQLVAGGHEEGWVVCQQLGQCAQFGNLSVRSRLLDFAITNAHPRSLQELIAARNEVEVGLLCAKVNACIDLDASTPDSDDGFVDAPTHQEDPDTSRTEDELETENGGRTDDEQLLTEEQDGYKADDEESEDVSEITDRGEEGSGGRRLLLGTLGVTKSVLSATASTTKTLVSNMSNKQFWRKAISWMEPLQEMSLHDSSIAEIDSNTNVSQQGCHAFYLDLVPDHHISNIGASYRSYAPPSINSPALDFSLTLLRIALLEETIAEGGVPKVNMDVIQEVARSVLKEDVPLGLMFLAMLKLPEKAHAVLSGFPRTDISLQMTQYYYALQIYTAIYPWEKANIASVFLHCPSEVINVVSRLVASVDTTSFEEEITEYIEYFKTTKELITDYVQGQALLRLGAGVDIDRFLVDGNYKEDTVLGLSMTLDTEVLELAVTLAKKYDVSLWQVYMTHLQFLFDSDVSTEELEKRSSDLKLLEELSKCPKEFVYNMEKNVLLTVNGCDHPRLLMYYSMLEEGGRNGESKQTQESVAKASAHIKFLKKLKGTASDLNYKQLLQPGTNILSLLRPVLTADNVGVFAKVAKSIPNSDGSGIEPSTVYCAWAQKCFFDYSKEKKPKVGSDWIHRYEKIGEYTQKMNEKDFEDFISGILFSSEGSENVPLDARREIIRRAIKFMRQQAGKTQIPEEGEPWKVGSERLEQWGNHLDVLRSDTFQQLQGSINPVLRKYAKEACWINELMSRI